MNVIVKNIIRFVFLLLLQALVLNQIEIGLGIQIMVYPIFILLLPFETGTLILLFLAFFMGILIDSISNTYGLHTSSLLLVAYLRPFVFNMFAPRDGYDVLKESTIYEMGSRWFLYVFGLLLLIHHFWFFLLEMFRIDAILFILQKTILSLPLSFGVAILLQMLFIRKPKER
ncbi:MAG: hypothetical protein ACK45H_14645 [Bacteroidota bacterium]|jgi:hypothetical protein